MEINDAINAIILALQEIFGDDYTYYSENIGQGLNLPCFFVQYVNGNEEYLVGNRFAVQSQFVVHGHVEENKKEELNQMATKLYYLEYITLSNGDIVRLENRNSKIENNEVFFYCDLNVHLIKKTTDDSENMENITIDGGVLENG